MPSIDEIIVGYRARHPLAAATVAKYGGDCIGCGQRVYFNPSAFPILAGGDHDARCVCTWCWDNDRLQIEDAMYTGAR